MKPIRSRLTYANVMTTIGVFLLLAGGTAIAAKQLGKNTVGAKQLKANAVTTAKIKKGAVTKAKIADGAIDSTKLADGSVNGAKIADGSVGAAEFSPTGNPLAHLVAEIRKPGPFSTTPGDTFEIGTYVQQPDEDNIYLASVDFTFSGGCAPPRQGVARLLVNAANPAAPEPVEIAAEGTVFDQTAGTTTKRMSFGPPLLGGGKLTRISPLSPSPRTFHVQLQAATCGSGTGITLTNGAVDVIGIK